MLGGRNGGVVTIGLPLIASFLLQRQDRYSDRPRLRFEYEGDELVEIQRTEV